jgi:hypothetical protein
LGCLLNFSDNIAGKILKENADICSDILTINYKKSVETGQVPLDWNHTNVTPVKGRQTFAKSIIIKSV